ncbi:MAG: CDP-diacylglycerol--glycerol-3-phosphate 3-phosphatidyltransferase [Sphaerochaetaceae bacterium]|jgi:CDP-diacylglycerol---glycerol-3-phosphate 3-phosphatidyltransferase|nr:CDP-diacylglycerol--glycerol-3-phosphate 3-phosphatidyltransferase [Sphaerochaetaceae bacterium]NLY07999.1 CDP-diacylglycerol--glycerol-3-phosphate 3-phosphatidyltransferase [Spirochaetales bacterium]
MNIPNKLTVSRLVMAPLFFICFNLPYWFGYGLEDISVILVLAIFVLNELSDLLDGKIARKRNLITDLGKVMDPFADTFSRITYFVCLMECGIMPSIAFIVILWRELGMLFVRMLMMGKGKPVPANIFGKSKAVLYAVSGVAGILLYAMERWFEGASWLSACGIAVTLLFYLAAVSSVASFLIYIRFIISDGSLKNMTR